MKFCLYPLLFLISLNSFSSIYYVAPSASGGSNSNNGSISSPWETITYALTQLSAGDTLYLREGTYRETITITQDGSSGNVITYDRNKCRWIVRKCIRWRNWMGCPKKVSKRCLE